MATAPGSLSTKAPEQPKSERSRPLMLCLVVLVMVTLTLAIGVVVAYTQDVWPFAQELDSPVAPDATLNVTIINVEFVTGESTDIYYPPSISPSLADGYPLLIFLKGGNVNKSDYSQILTQMAQQGYVATVSDLLSVGFPFPTQSMIPNTLRELEVFNRNASHPLFGAVDLEQTFIGGHSFGALMSIASLTKRCQFSPPFCSEPFVLDARIKGCLVFGFNQLSMNGTSCGPQDSSVQCGPIGTFCAILLFPKAFHVCTSSPLRAS